MPFPNNMIDAVNQIKSGQLGNFKDCKIGDLLVSALLSLSGPDTAQVTTRRVESGYTIAQAITKDAIEKTLRILLANNDYSVGTLTRAALTGNVDSLGETWRDKYATLKSYFDANTLLVLQTHDAVYADMVIVSIDPEYDTEEDYDAFICSVTLRQIKTSATQIGTGYVDAALETVGAL